jgi:hypothetical protein
LQYLHANIDMEIFCTVNNKQKSHINELPTAFCWTKMGAEAGQSLSGIIARKDVERDLGNGVFFWGIGSSLGIKLWSFIEGLKSPDILFSPMKTKAKKVDAKPSRIFAWTSYLDRNGVKHPVPLHSLVTSRGTVGKKLKTSHYALVCHKETTFFSESWPQIEWNNLRNYKSRSKLGFSQVTSLVEANNGSKSLNSSYQVLFGAKLVSPYFVKLVDPVEVPPSLWAEANDNWSNNRFDAQSWQKWLNLQVPSFVNVELTS